eukprot:TRINITY_DN13949_c0_g1_i1.p2 TRINITY_DN13949_c0_g1~~TRINITY_DN13949_c0_g1_i1.p2  ORF type:complete len:265 (+),score=30.54 TRINITY_DN13949_c0_g1_i1:248-1042(+)
MQPPTGRFLGRTVVVTCGTSPLGFGIARRLCLEGAHVTLCGPRRDQVEAAVQDLGSEGLKAIGVVLGTSGVERLVRTVRLQYRTGLDCLILGDQLDQIHSQPAANVLSITDQQWRTQVDTTIKKCFFLARALKPALVSSGASVIFLTSTMGYTAVPGWCLASIASSAMLALTKALASSWASDCIRVNCVACGIEQGESVVTHELGLHGRGQHELVPDLVAELVPMQRLTSPKDCAAAVCFLCSQDAEYITGETIVLNGGVPSRL